MMNFPVGTRVIHLDGIGTVTESKGDTGTIKLDPKYGGTICEVVFNVTCRRLIESMTFDEAINNIAGVALTERSGF